MNRPPIVDPQEWDAARQAMLDGWDYPDAYHG